MSYYEILRMLFAGECFDMEANEVFIREFTRGKLKGNSVKDCFLDSKAKLTAFIAQCSHESEGLSDTEEDFYTTPSIIKRVFSKYVKDDDHAVELSRDPKKLFNLTYGSRMGNRPGTDDGWDYRGRGWIGLTGLDNYEAYTQFSGVDALHNPDLLLDNTHAFYSSLMFFVNRTYKGMNLLEIAEFGDHARVSRLINGGDNGLKHRLELTDKITKEVNGELDKPLDQVNRSSSRMEVKEAQYILSLLGYSPGSVDGWWGRATRLAVNKFKESTGEVCSLDNLHTDLEVLCENNQL